MFQCTEKRGREAECSQMSSWLNVKVNRWEGMGTENHLIGLNKASQSTCYIGIPVFVKFTFWCENIAVGRSVLMLILCSWATCSLLAFSPSLFASCLNVSFPLHSGSRSSKTFKPKKNIPEGSHQYELLKHAEATLGSGNLRMAVMLPEGEDLNEWVAVNSKLANTHTHTHTSWCWMWADTCGKTTVYFFLVMFTPLCTVLQCEKMTLYHLKLTDAEWHTETILLKLLVPEVWSCP